MVRSETPSSSASSLGDPVLLCSILFTIFSSFSCNSTKCMIVWIYKELVYSIFLWVAADADFLYTYIPLLT